MSIESVMPSNHLIVVVRFSSPLQSFPASRSFQMSQLLASDGQNIGASASTSVLPMSSQGLFPLGLTGLTLLSRGFEMYLPPSHLWLPRKGFAFHSWSVPYQGSF